jgi:hypothetical protein
MSYICRGYYLPVNALVDFDFIQVANAAYCTQQLETWCVGGVYIRMLDEEEWNPKISEGRGVI